MKNMPLAIGLFALTYILMLCLPKYRRYVALGSAAIFLLTGMLPVTGAVSYINFNVLMMIAGTMGIVSLLSTRKCRRAWRISCCPMCRM